MKLVKLGVENFLSLENVEIPLGKLTVLVGPNASGKSNVVRALEFLSIWARSRTLPSPSALGYSSWRDLLFNGESRKIRFSLTFEREGERVELRLQHDSPLSGEPDCLDFLSRIRVYNFDPYKIKARASPPSHTVELAKDGFNLAQVLHTLLVTNRRKFFEIEETLKWLIPEVEELNVPTTPDGRRVYLLIKERGLSQQLSGPGISDGTLRILAFVTAMKLASSSLVAFEEPENCIHPRLIESLIDLCRKSEPQVLITTHSPLLLDHVSVDEILLVRKEKGRTIISPIPDKEKVRQLLLEGYAMGELWQSGELEQ